MTKQKKNKVFIILAILVAFLATSIAILFIMQENIKGYTPIFIALDEADISKEQSYAILDIYQKNYDTICDLQEKIKTKNYNLTKEDVDNIDNLLSIFNCVTKKQAIDFCYYLFAPPKTFGLHGLFCVFKYYDSTAVEKLKNCDSLHLEQIKIKEVEPVYDELDGLFETIYYLKNYYSTLSQQDKQILIDSFNDLITSKNFVEDVNIKQLVKCVNIVGKGFNNAEKVQIAINAMFKYFITSDVKEKVLVSTPTVNSAIIKIASSISTDELANIYIEYPSKTKMLNNVFLYVKKELQDVDLQLSNELALLLSTYNININGNLIYQAFYKCRDVYEIDFTQEEQEFWQNFLQQFKNFQRKIYKCDALQYNSKLLGENYE